MALRPVLLFPDPLLKRVSEPIEKITDEIRQLAADMCDVMYDEPGIGLAAPQVGEAVRLIVIDTEWNTDEEDPGPRNPLVLINPEFIEQDGQIVWEEGCLSVPDITAEVTRARRVVVKGLDLEGDEVVVEAEELKAVCLQHEIDHLDGILFIDHLSRLKRSLYVKKRKKQLAAERD
jgi:peptide deformylase